MENINYSHVRQYLLKCQEKGNQPGTPKITNVKNKIKAKPVLKWAGGKQQMLDVIVPHVPKKFNKYIEPFVAWLSPNYLHYSSIITQN